MPIRVNANNSSQSVIKKTLKKALLIFGVSFFFGILKYVAVIFLLYKILSSYFIIFVVIEP